MDLTVFVVVRVGCLECDGVTEILIATTDWDEAEHCYFEALQKEYANHGYQYGPTMRRDFSWGSGEDWPIDAVYGERGTDWALAIYQK